MPKLGLSTENHRNQTPVILKLVDGTYLKGVLHWKKVHQRLVDALNKDDLIQYLVLTGVSTKDGGQSAPYFLKADRIAYVIVEKANIPLSASKNFAEVVKKVAVKVKVRIANDELEGDIYIRPIFTNLNDAVDSLKDNFLVLDHVISLRGKSEQLMFLNRSHLMYIMCQPE